MDLDDDKSFIYVDKITLNIFRISHWEDPEDQANEYHKISIPRKLGIELIESPHKLLNYTVFYDGSAAVFIEKEKIQTNLLLNYTPELIKEVKEQQDLTFYIKENKIEIVLKEELSSYAAQIAKSLSEEKQTSSLYISAKNNPNKLLKIVKFNMLDLTKPPYKIEADFSYTDSVSMFMKKYFFNTCGFIKK